MKYCLPQKCGEGAEKAGRERIVDEKENGRVKALWH